MKTAREADSERVQLALGFRTHTQRTCSVITGGKPGPERGKNDATESPPLRQIVLARRSFNAVLCPRCKKLPPRKHADKQAKLKGKGSDCL